MNQDVSGEPLLTPSDTKSTAATTQTPSASANYCAYTAQVLRDPHNTKHDRSMLFLHAQACQQCGDLVAEFYGPVTDEAPGGTA